MDFECVSDMNSPKYNSYLPNSSGQQETPAFGRRGLQDTLPERLLPPLAFNGTLASHTTGFPAVRRPRAGTMPSRTGILPTTTTSTTLTVPTNPSVTYSTVNIPSITNGEMYLNGGSSTNPAASSIDAGRRRSGSVSLLSSSNATKSSQDYGKYLFTSGFSSQHITVEESSSDAMQRTLASLGLEDTTHNNPPPASLVSPSYLPPSVPPSTDINKQQQLRPRAYTVSARNPSSSGDRHGHRLPLMEFSPFSPQTRSNVVQRPRAASLGMANQPDFGTNELSSFTPFDVALPSRTSKTLPKHYQQELTPSPLDHQISLDTQRALRTSRSIGNMMDLSYEQYWSTNRYDGTEACEDGSMDDTMHHDDFHATASVSSSSSALLDSPCSAPDQTPSRALWLGNINPAISVNDLILQFSVYGHVESARILSDKECAFVNFTTVDSAVAAKTDLESRLDSKLGGTLVRIGFGKVDATLAMALTNESGPNAQGPTRALWVGNIPSTINIPLLQAIFQAFGPIESVRVLSHKNCGFINFVHQEDAVRARKNLQNKEILGPGSGTVRIGFAKTPSLEDITNTESTLVSIPHHQQTTSPVPHQMNQQKQQTVLQHQYHNGPQHQRYHQYITPANPKEQLWFEAPTRTAPSVTANTTFIVNEHQDGNNHNSLPADTYQATQWATAMMTDSLMNGSRNDATIQPNLYSVLSSERRFIMQQLCSSSDITIEERAPISYFFKIPAVPELGTDRILEPLRLRDMRKRLENGQALQDVELMAQECMNEIVELCSDYIGNTVVQKLYEQCTESTKQAMLERIAPYLAAIGVHKNGTWAAQKIVDYANTPAQIDTIQQHIAPYVPLLLLDQFGNYVVQCCLRKGADHNQYIFDAVADKCWEIGQGRFGARAVRAILENEVVTNEQRIYCAAAIVQNAALLTTNPNGTLLLNWLLDTSNLPGRHCVLYPRLLPHLNKLCNHKSGSIIVFKIIQQQVEPDISRLFLDALIRDPSVLDDILRDQVHGAALMQKIIGLHHVDADQRMEVGRRIRASLDRLGAQYRQGYRKLGEELDRIPQENDLLSSRDKGVATTQLESASGSTTDSVSWMKDPQAVAMMANMYAAAMTATATSQHQLSSTTKAADLSPFNHPILKSLLVASSAPAGLASDEINVVTSRQSPPVDSKAL